MWRGILLLGALALGCGAQAITTPSGRPGYALRCVNSTAKCFANAGDSCGGGYDVLSQNQRLDPATGWTYYDLTVECSGH
jgi:hypothetical protein